MRTVIAHFYAKPERAPELLKILSAWPIAAQTEPGCIDYYLHGSEEDPNVLMFYENWGSRGDLDEHLNMPYLKQFMDRRMDYLVRDIEVKYSAMKSPSTRVRS
jgi:quinol monooxygenase YgiN